MSRDCGHRSPRGNSSAAAFTCSIDVGGRVQVRRWPSCFARRTTVRWPSACGCSPSCSSAATTSFHSAWRCWNACTRRGSSTSWCRLRAAAAARRTAMTPPSPETSPYCTVPQVTCRIQLSAPIYKMSQHLSRDRRHFVVRLACDQWRRSLWIPMPPRYL